MRSRKLSRVVTILASALLVLSGASVAAGSEGGPAPAPENLRLVVNGQGFVDRLEWDPPSVGSEPGLYDVNYRFANTGPIGEQVFWSTRDTFLDASSSFGRFVECTPQHRPDEEWVVWITYRTANGSSERSNQVSMCFP